MTPEDQLRAKLRKIEALYAGAGTAGERLAAGAASARIKARLAATQREAPAVEHRIALPDGWSVRLFLALARRYGLAPYRRPRQRRTTVMLRAPDAFVRDVLWPQFQALNAALAEFLEAATERLIQEEVHADTADAPEVPEALP
ncbi:MAG: hypothetical protein EXQ87_08290 [Alphaproteobacteria bacterium]|nr:hypothetical protein [Alphaproteobacteria bacterium]